MNAQYYSQQQQQPLPPPANNNNVVATAMTARAQGQGSSGAAPPPSNQQQQMNATGVMNSTEPQFNNAATGSNGKYCFCVIICLFLKMCGVGYLWW